MLASEAEQQATPGALAPRSTTAISPGTSRTLTGGAGLFDHTDRDAIGARGGAIAGILGIVVTVGIAIVLVSMNPKLRRARRRRWPVPNLVRRAESRASNGLIARER